MECYYLICEFQSQIDMISCPPFQVMLALLTRTVQDLASIKLQGGLTTPLNGVSHLCQKRVPATWAVNLVRSQMQSEASCQDIVKAQEPELNFKSMQCSLVGVDAVHGWDAAS